MAVEGLPPATTSSFLVDVKVMTVPTEGMREAVLVQLRVEPQDTWSEARIAAVDDGVAFSAWNGLAVGPPHDEADLPA